MTMKEPQVDTTLADIHPERLLRDSILQSESLCQLLQTLHNHGRNQQETSSKG